MVQREEQAKIKTCPYWSKGQGAECKMTKGGLYIPMPEHVDMFCSSERYVQCHQFLRGCELLQETAKKYGFIVEGERRRFRRVPGKVSLAVTSYNNHNESQSLDGQAQTLDLSLGGLRIESHCDLPIDSMVSFDFGPDFSIPDISGVGRVKWCECRNGSALYEVGVAFSDLSLTQAIGTYLGLPMV